jgi:hypothetical protein
MKTLKMIALSIAGCLIISTSSFAGDGVKADAKRTFRTERSCAHTTGCPMNKVLKHHAKHAPKHHLDKHA